MPGHAGREWLPDPPPGTRQPLDTLLPTAGREGAGARGSGVATRPTTAQAVHSGGRHPNPGGDGATQPPDSISSLDPPSQKTHAITTRASATLANACCRHPRVSYAAKAMQRVLCGHHARASAPLAHAWCRPPLRGAMPPRAWGSKRRIDNSGRGTRWALPQDRARGLLRGYHPPLGSVEATHSLLPAPSHPTLQLAPSQRRVVNPKVRPEGAS